MSKVQEILRGSAMTGFECCGMSGVVTKGAYVEPVPGNINHALTLMQQVNSTHYWGNGEKVKNKEKETCSLNVSALKKAMKKSGFTPIPLCKKTCMTRTTFQKAYTGENIYMMTAKRIAVILCVEVESILN